MPRAALAILSTILVVLFGVPAFAASTDAELATKTYVLNAAMCELFGVESGKLGQEKASDPAIREFGKVMVEDHTKSGAKLREVITTLQLESQMPKALDKEHQHRLQELSEVERLAFDREFLSMQIKGHEAALALHQAYANTGPDEPVRAIAADAAKLIERHLIVLRRIKNLPAGGA